MNKNPTFFDFWEPVIPSEEEVKFLSFANSDCYYYYKGISECRFSVLNNPEKTQKSFVPCAKVVDQYHRCVTQNKLGGIDDLDEKGKQYFKNFSKCMYWDFKNLDSCREHYDDIVRYNFRKEDSPLKGLY